MISSFDIRSLDRLLVDFYTVVGIRISIFDDDFCLVTEYPKEAPAFCRNIRKSEEGAKACHACDKAACLRARKLRRPHIYICHAGVTEAITPIAVGGAVLGYAILAHMLPVEGYEDAKSRACTLAETYGVPYEESMTAILDISKRTTKEIDAAVRLLDAIASYVYISHLASWKNEEISKVIDEYIRCNLSSELTSETICGRFHFSRTRLYQISMQAFGMGITKYVEHCRIEQAKKLLSDGESIARIACDCGYNEYHYFCKVFKKVTGMSPSEYRKKRK